MIELTIFIIKLCKAKRCDNLFYRDFEDYSERHEAWFRKRRYTFWDTHSQSSSLMNTHLPETLFLLKGLYR